MMLSIAEVYAALADDTWNVSMEHWYSDTDGRAEVLGGKKPVPLTLSPPEIKLCMNLIKNLVIDYEDLDV